MKTQLGEAILMNSEQLTERLLDKLDKVCEELAAIQERLKALEAEYKNHTRPCSFFVEHQRQHEENKAFARSVIGYVLGGTALSLVLTISGAVCYALSVGWRP